MKHRYNRRLTRAQARIRRQVDALAARDAFQTVAKRYKGGICFAIIINDGNRNLIEVATTHDDTKNLRHSVTWMAVAGHIRAASFAFEDERCRRSGLEALHDTTSPCRATASTIEQLLKTLAGKEEEEA